MPRNSGTGVYTPPSGLTAVSGSTIESADWNNLISDITATLNAAWPEGLGGTTFSSWAAAKADVLSSSSGTTLLKASNLSDLVSIPTARTNLGLTDTATAPSTAVGKALINAADAAAQRTALGLGTASTLNVGTAANNVVQLNGTAKLPAVDGSLLTNISVGYAQVLDSGANAGSVRCAYSTPIFSFGATMTYTAAYEVISIAITPKRAGSVVEVEFSSRHVSYDPVGAPTFNYALGLFQDSAVDGVTTTTNWVAGRKMAAANDRHGCLATFRWVSPDTSAHTLRICSVGDYGDFSHRHEGNRVVVRENI